MKSSSFVCNEFTFKIIMDENKQVRWNGEGVYQNINIYINDYEIFNTTWGSEFLLETITYQKELQPNDCPFSDILFQTDELLFKTDGFDLCFKSIKNADYIDFSNWLISTISPIEGRKIKISKIKNIINGKMLQCE